MDESGNVNGKSTKRKRKKRRHRFLKIQLSFLKNLHHFYYFYYILLIPLCCWFEMKLIKKKFFFIKIQKKTELVIITKCALRF